MIPARSQGLLSARRPSLVLDLTAPLPTDVTFSRPSLGWTFNNAGVLTEYASGVARIAHDPLTGAVQGVLPEEGKVNQIRNPRCEGAVSGTPGTLPTYWVDALTAGLSRSIVGTGTVNGIPFVDIRYSGTATGYVVGVGIEATSVISASVGQTFTGSVFIGLPWGSLSGVSSVRLQISEYNGNTYLSDHFSSDFKSSLAQSVVRFYYTATTVISDVSKLRYILSIGVNSGTSYDFTLRIGAPQLELGGLTSPIFPPVGNLVPSTRAADVLLMPLGSWYNPLEVTIIVTARRLHAGNFLTYPYLYALSDGSDNNIIRCYGTQGYSSITNYTVKSNGVAQTPYMSGIVPGTDRFIVGQSYSRNMSLFCVNGIVDNPYYGQISLPTVTTLTIGCTYNNAAQWGGVIESVRIYPRAMSADELRLRATL